MYPLQLVQNILNKSKKKKKKSECEDNVMKRGILSERKQISHKFAVL